MAQDRINAITLGAFYIAAAVTSVIAIIFYDQILSEQWYMTVADGMETRVLIGVLNDVLLIMAIVGTAVLMFPYVRLWSEHIALGYLLFRFMEAVFIAIGLVGILALLQVSGFTLGSGESELGLGSALQAFHGWTFILGPNLMLGVNTFLYSYLLFRTGIVPKGLAVFGILTAVMVFIGGLLEMFGIVEPFSTVKGLIALPVGVYEMSLAVWLIVKGFNQQKLKELREK